MARRRELESKFNLPFYLQIKFTSIDVESFQGDEIKDKFDCTLI